jgi:hypothetical protein
MEDKLRCVTLAEGAGQLNGSEVRWEGSQEFLKSSDNRMEFLRSAVILDSSRVP